MSQSSAAFTFPFHTLPLLISTFLFSCLILPFSCLRALFFYFLPSLQSAHLYPFSVSLTIHGPFPLLLIFIYFCNLKTIYAGQRHFKRHFSCQQVCPMHFHCKISHVGLFLLLSLPCYIYFYMVCIPSCHAFSNQSFLPNCPRVSLNTIAGNCRFSLLLCSLDPSLRLALRWQVCSQCDARFCCAMLRDAKSPAGGQQPSFMRHYFDRGPLSLALSFSFFFSFFLLSLYPFLHFSTISKSPIWMAPAVFLDILSFKLISVVNPLCPPLDCINSTVL